MALESDGLLRAPVLRAVAEPATIFLVPIPLVAINVTISFTTMMFLVVFLDWSPLGGFAFMFIGHAVLATLSVKDKHIANNLQCRGKPLRKSINLVPPRGTKLLP